MKSANQQKLIIGTSILAVAALLATTIWNQPKFFYEGPTEAERQAIQDAQSKSLAEYRKYLEDIGADPVASTALFDQILDKDQIAKEIRADIGADKPIVIPVVDQSKLTVVDTTNSEDMASYVQKLKNRLDDYHTKVTPNLDGVLNEIPDPVRASTADKDSQALLSDLYAMPVPKDAAGMQSSLVSAYTASGQVFADADEAAKKVEPSGQWVNSTTAYATTRTQIENLNRSSRELGQRYGILQDESVDAASMASNPFIKAAEAGVPVSVLVDIVRIAEQFLRSALGQIVLNYIKSALVKNVKNIEKNYIVSNFLYYTDALVNTKYANDYLAKYVPSKEDQRMIKSFLPQFNCGRQNEEQAKKELIAAATNYLGFDKDLPLDPTDPNFYKQLSKSTHLRSSSDGSAILFKALAVVAEQRAQSAVGLELTSPGKKVGFAAGDKNQAIITSLDGLRNQQLAALNALFQIGPGNATTGGWGFDNFIINTTLGIINQFVVKGAVTVKEQRTCVKVPVFNPIVPGDFSPNSLTPTAEEIAECLQDSSVCTEIIFGITNCPSKIAVQGGGQLIPKGVGTSYPNAVGLGSKFDLRASTQPECVKVIADIDEDSVSVNWTATVYAGVLPAGCGAAVDKNKTTVVGTANGPLQSISISIDTNTKDKEGKAVFVAPTTPLYVIMTSPNGKVCMTGSADIRLGGARGARRLPVVVGWSAPMAWTI